MPYVISSLIALVVCTLLGYILPPVATYILVGIVSTFMIGLILIQRGRGGGLAGAFGGVGGSSAFGTRAGDVFTRITIVAASVWIALNMGLVVNANVRSRQAADPANIGSEFLPKNVRTGAGASGTGSALPDFGDDLGRDLGTPAPSPADPVVPDLDLPSALGDDDPTPEPN